MTADEYWNGRHEWTCEGIQPGGGVTGIVFGADTYRDAWRKIAGELHVSGPRTLLATRSDGASVTASLYDGEDAATGADGRNLTYLLA